MVKKNSVLKIESDGSEKLLVEMVERFSARRAIDWLRVKFPSFDTGRAEAIACDATKNEKDYFAAAELLGYVTRMPQGKTDDSNRPLVVAAVKMKKDMTERTSRLVQLGVLYCMVRLLARLDPQSLSIRQHLLDRYRVDKAVVDPTESACPSNRSSWYNTQKLQYGKVGTCCHENQ